MVSREGPIKILDSIDLDIAQSETIAIIGQSGSGKTTLLSILAGLDIPTQGSVHLFNHSLETLTEDQRASLRGQYIGFVFQAFHLLPGYTALENTMLPLEIAENREAKTIARDLLERVGMAHRENHFPSTLSGGEQQRVAIARAFATSPPLLLADEPTGNLDAKTGANVIDALFRVNSESETTLVLVTHDKSLSQRCDRCFQLQDGRLDEL